MRGCIHAVLRDSSTTAETPQDGLLSPDASHHTILGPVATGATDATRAAANKATGAKDATRAAANGATAL